MRKTDFCKSCKYVDCILVPPLKVKTPDLLVIGEAPGGDEEKVGQPFVGKAGKKLRKIMREVGFNMARVAITNTVICRPHGNEKPNKKEIDLCSKQFLFTLIRELQPKMIMCAGEIARKAIKAEVWQDIPVAHVLHPGAYRSDIEKTTEIMKVHSALYPV